MNLWRRIHVRLGVVILIAAFSLALARVLTLQSREVATHKKVIRMVHWQLETGVGEAIDEIGREYSKLHPDVEVQQILIGERGYGSWITTRLIGGTAPELIQMGQMDRPLINQLWLRYCQPLSDEILKPNPYHRGTPLEDAPWKDTFTDDMLGGFATDLLEYYQVPASGFTVRLFYNKALLRQATGLDAPPSDFRRFMEACDRIKAYGRERGQPLVPIAGAGKYNATFLFGRFEQAVNSSLLAETDLNRDGDPTVEESLIALVGGRVDFRDPRITAMFKGREYYIEQFQPAFFPADRMDAAFLFIQQKALMIASGSWDAGSYVKQADFEIGVCDFPLPARDDPEFSRFVEGPAVEEMRGGFAFSVNRSSAHPDVALDFMKFLSSRPMNDRLNRRIKWIPMVRGNTPDPFIAPFWPRLDGVKNGIDLSGGPQNFIVMTELLNLHAAGRLDFDGFARRYESKFVANADVWMKLDRPRQSQLAAAQDEFRKNTARSLGRLGATDGDKARVISAGQIERRAADTELFQRYAEARAHTKLPAP